MVDWFFSLPLWVYGVLTGVEVLAMLVLERRLRRAVRHRRVRRERDAPDLRSSAPPLSRPGHQPDVARPALREVRPAEPWDSRATRAAFEQRLALQDRYVDELRIEDFPSRLSVSKRLN